MAVSKDHASFWVHKDLTVTGTTKHSGFVDSIRVKGVGRKGRMSSATDRYRGGILDGHRDRQIRRFRGYGFQGTVTAGDESTMIKKGGNGSTVCESAGGKEKAAEEGKGGTQRGRIQLEPSGTGGLCLGITWHPCDKIHSVFVRQPSAVKGCEKMGRQRWESDVNRSARRKHFMGSNRRGHYCGKSAAMRTHTSNQATQPSTTASLASVCVDSNSTRMTEARVEGARSAIFLRDKE